MAENKLRACARIKKAVVVGIQKIECGENSTEILWYVYILFYPFFGVAIQSYRIWEYIKLIKYMGIYMGIT